MFQRQQFRQLSGSLVRCGLPILALIAVIATNHPAFGRAGGGEGFGGGGGGFGGGGGGGGGGGSGLVYLLVWLLIQNPEIGIPVLIVCGIFYYFTHRSVAGYVRDQRTQNGLDAIDANAEAEALSALKLRDPAFMPDAFYKRVGTAFLKIQESWSNQKLDTIRPFISDGVYQRFSIQFAQQKAEGYCDRMQRVNIETIAMVHLTSDNVFDSAVVRIDADALDQHISLSDETVLSGGYNNEPFAEYWTFLRRRGTKTLNKDGLIEGNCPNCGAPIELNAQAQCTNCKALLRSGQYDWVLVDIAQESEWQPEYPRNLPGVDDLQKIDPDFNIPDIEDRVSVMFWRKAQADRLGKVDPLRKAATQSFCDSYARMLQNPSTHLQGGRQFWGDCAVGAVDTLGAIPGKPFDQALVEVHASARLYQDMGDGKLIRTQQSNLALYLFVLERTSGIKTTIAASISSAHCPSCGAPETDDTSSNCSFCGAVLNDGSHGWVLAEILPASGTEAQVLIHQLASIGSTTDENDPVMQNQATQSTGLPQRPPPQIAGLVAWAVKTTVHNNGLDDAQEQMLRNVAQKQNVTDEQLHRLLLAAQAGQLQTREPQSSEEVQSWLGTLIRAAIVSGPLTESELRLFNGIGFKYGLSVYDVQNLIRRQKADLYRDVVTASRQLKRNQSTDDDQTPQQSDAA